MNYSLHLAIVYFVIKIGIVGSANAVPFSFDIPVANSTDVSVSTWTDKRDSKLTKQDLDFSCGASSLSTILTYFYEKPTSEKQLLEDMDLPDVMASFDDLSKVSEKYGFIAKGVATNYETLAKIKIPVIVYLNHKRNDHFSVVRAIDNNKVYLSDSSWGNRILSRKQFEKMWNTRNDLDLKGRVLLILPSNEQQKQQIDDKFTVIQDAQKLLRESPSLFREFL